MQPNVISAANLLNHKLKVLHKYVGEPDAVGLQLKAIQHPVLFGWQGKAGHVVVVIHTPTSQFKLWTLIPFALYSAKMTSTPFCAMNNASHAPTPNPKIRTLSDGCVQVMVGEFKATVSSMHLVEDKVVRLTDYWRKAHHRSRF